MLVCRSSTLPGLTQFTRTLQAYAPLRASELIPAGSSDLPERYLYLFACLAPGCRNEPDAWRAVRAQRVSPVTSAAATGSVEKHAQPGPSSTPVSALPVTDWSAAADDWSGGGDGGAGGGSGQAELSSLATELDAALAVSSAADAQGGKHRVAASSAAGSTGGSAQLQRRPAPGPNALPEFFISAEDEPEDEDGGSASRRVDPKAMPLEAMAAALAGDEDDKVTTSGGESWAGEAYESTTVRGVPKQFLRFQKRLRKCPEQCVRYGVAAEPLWPTTRRPQAWLAAQHQLPSAQQRNSGGAAPVGTACASCGGSLRFEAQLMAPLIHFFCQGAESDGALSDALLDWEWTTVVLLTCGRVRAMKCEHSSTLALTLSRFSCAELLLGDGQ